MSNNPPQQSKSGTSHNPYAQAAGAYSDNAQKHTTNQRDLESMILMKSARMLQEVKDAWGDKPPADYEEILKYNRQVWLVFYDTAVENPEDNRPDDLRSNIINLANFIFKREIEIVTDPRKEKLDVLININKEIAAGLVTRQQSEQNAEGEETPQD